MSVRKIRSYLESDGVNIRRDKFFFWGGGWGTGRIGVGQVRARHFPSSQSAPAKNTIYLCGT